MAKNQIIFHSGVGTVTGANFSLRTNAGNFLVDCGLVQGERVAEEINAENFGFEVGDVDALFITHAHLDHVGRIPKMVKEGYDGPIYSTPQTKALAELVLRDAVNILAMEAKREDKEIIYDLADVERAFNSWKTIDYHEKFALAHGVDVILRDAGHILGSAMIEFTVNHEGRTQKILFTGDLGNSPSPLLRDTEEPGLPDYMVIESVYGDRNHESKEARTEQFKKIIEDSIKRGGTLVIPAFSIDRTQIILYELNNMVENGLIPSVPVFVDSPMAIRATDIYASNTMLFNEGVLGQITKGDNIFAFPKLEFTMSKNDSEDIQKMKGAKIILAGSGMSVGGRVIGHEAHYLPDPKSTILLVGYQAAGSLGRQLADGSKKVKVYGDTIKVKAKIETMYGFSAHRDSDHLLEFVSKAGDNLKKVFVVMGEPRASMYLAQRINNELETEAVVPERGLAYELS
jgi:metallo-beta-lactamase family protein